MQGKRGDAERIGEILRRNGHLWDVARFESNAGDVDELVGGVIECDRNAAPRTNDVGELREHEGGRGDEIGRLGYGSEKLGEAFSAELRAGSYRYCLTLRVVQVAASDLHFPTEPAPAPPRHRP